MTPMEKLKPQFKELKNFLGFYFKELNLNKSEYKVNIIGNCEETIAYTNKGVKSDFIRLYTLSQNKENTYTIAFSFNYLDLE